MPKYVYADHTPETLAAMAEMLEDNASVLRAAAESMRLQKFETLAVTNNDQRKRGLEFIESFVGAVRTAYRLARESRGDLQPLEPPKPGKKPPKK
jgi:hypothetical protein